MKRYKLIKDLPTFKARQEFELDKNGDLVLRYGDVSSVVYSRRELEKFPNILTDWFEQVAIGFYLDGEGCIVEYDENEDPYYLNYRKSIGNDFKTEEEAKEYKKYLVALQIVKDDAKGFIPDWEDGNQLKYCGYYGHSYNHLDWANASYIQNQGIIYFKSKQDIQDSFKKHRKEWLVVLGIKEED